MDTEVGLSCPQQVIRTAEDKSTDIIMVARNWNAPFRAFMDREFMMVVVERTGYSLEPIC